MKNIWQKYGYGWVTLGIFAVTLMGHWLFAWPAYVAEQTEHNQEIAFKDYFNQTARDTLENWQSEFLQLVWQVAGLAYLFYLGSPQSKEGDERKEEKLDLILQKLDPKEGQELIKKLDEKYPRA